jgi:hypothetical protein
MNNAEEVSSRTILFPDDDGSDLRARLVENEPTRILLHTLELFAAGLHEAALDRLVEFVNDLLGVEARDVLVRGWAKGTALRAAATRTLEQQTQEIVELARHDIVSTHEPKIEVMVDQTRIGTIGFTIVLALDIHVADVLVVDGRIASIASGRADATASLSCENSLIKSATRTIDLHLNVDLGDGIPLALREPSGNLPTPSPPAGVTPT